MIKKEKVDGLAIAFFPMQVGLLWRRNDALRYTPA
tara:strand:- start:6526 stop:6630 length:105 start_codon:yes stop_codon:yes gene_type:complete